MRGKTERREESERMADGMKDEGRTETKGGEKEG